MFGFRGRCAGAALWTLGLALATDNAPAKLILIAHRGASPEAPENTLAAFNRAKTVADFVEYDVWPTKDGQLVVIHDSTLERTTNGTGAVSDHTLAEIQQLDAGSWFNAACAGEKIPTADETIAAIQTDAAPFMERKSGTVEQFVALLNRQPLRPEGIVMSTDYAFVVALKQAKPALQIGWIGAEPLSSSQITQAIADGVSHFVWANPNIDAATVNAVHQAGGLVFGWTVDDPGTIAALSDLGVDGIITNRSADLATTPVFSSSLGTDQVQPPIHAVVRPGSSAVLETAASGHVAHRVQWRRAADSAVIGTGPVLRLSADNPQSYGHYVASWVKQGTPVSCDHVVTAGGVDNQLVNISARMTIGSGDATGIVGFVVKSPGSPRFLLRAVGPSLAGFGITNPVPNPLLTLFHRSAVIDSDTIGSRTYATAADFVRNGAFPLAPGGADVAVMRDLEAGAYTVHLSTANGSGGIGLIEVYQDNSASNWADGAAINVSLRGRAIVGSPLIGGFVVPDGSSETVLVRGIGPSLARFGIADPLRDPAIRIVDSKQAIVAENDEWWADGNSAMIQQVSARVGAFHISAGREAAVLVTLAPGAYTAILADASDTGEGVGLLEIYAVSADQLPQVQ